MGIEMGWASSLLGFPLVSILQLSFVIYYNIIDFKITSESQNFILFVKLSNDLHCFLLLNNVRCIE